MKSEGEKVSARRMRAFRRRLLAWYVVHGRRFPWRRTNEPSYRMIVAEVLLQRTRAETVAAFYSTFFRRFPSWRRLGAAQPWQLERFLRPLGLWRRRADTLVRLASAINARRGRLPREREEIEGLPGVGQYVANAVQLIRWRIPAPLLDVNMARVLERYFGPRCLADIRYDPYLQSLAWRLVDDGDSLSTSWAILDLGAMVCMRRLPRCGACPLRRGCSHAR